jgi:hypothetical protein
MAWNPSCIGNICLHISHGQSRSPYISVIWYVYRLLYALTKLNEII